SDLRQSPALSKHAERYPARRQQQRRAQLSSLHRDRPPLLPLHLPILPYSSACSDAASGAVASFGFALGGAGPTLVLFVSALRLCAYRRHSSRAITATGTSTIS